MNTSTPPLSSTPNSAESGWQDVSSLLDIKALNIHLEQHTDTISRFADILIAPNKLNSSALVNLNEAYSHKIGIYMEMLKRGALLPEKSDDHPSLPSFADVLRDIDTTFEDYVNAAEILSSYKYTVNINILNRRVDTNTLNCHMKTVQGGFHRFMLIELRKLSPKIVDSKRRKSVDRSVESHRKAAERLYLAAHELAKKEPHPGNIIGLGAIESYETFMKLDNPLDQNHTNSLRMFPPHSIETFII